MGGKSLNASSVEKDVKAGHFTLTTKQWAYNAVTISANLVLFRRSFTFFRMSYGWWAFLASFQRFGGGFTIFYLALSNFTKPDVETTEE